MNGSLICHIINTIDTQCFLWLLYIYTYISRIFFSPKENRFLCPIRTLNFSARTDTDTDTRRHTEAHTQTPRSQAAHTFTHTLVARSSHNFETRNTIRNIINVLCVAFWLRSWGPSSSLTTYTGFAQHNIFFVLVFLSLLLVAANLTFWRYFGWVMKLMRAVLTIL